MLYLKFKHFCWTVLDWLRVTVTSRWISSKEREGWNGIKSVTISVSGIIAACSIADHPHLYHWPTSELSHVKYHYRQLTCLSPAIVIIVSTLLVFASLAGGNINSDHVSTPATDTRPGHTALALVTCYQPNSILHSLLHFPSLRVPECLLLDAFL